MKALGGRAASVLVGISTMVVIVAVAILPFLTPQWIGFEQDRAGAQAWTGYTADELRLATGAILADLVLGPPDFDVEVAGVAVLAERERGHMRDVRTVFMGFGVAAALSLVVLVVAAWRMTDRERLWRSIRRGATILAVAVVALGLVAVTSFDTLFSAFHQILFPAGSFTFDPATERMVQLFPFQFWQETAMVAGVLIIAIGVVVAFVAHRRETRPSRVPANEPAGVVAAPG